MALITRAMLDEPARLGARATTGEYLEQAVKRAAPQIVAPERGERALEQSSR